MSTTTSEIGRARSPVAESRGASGGAEQGPLGRYAWWGAALGLLIFSAVLVRVSGTRPGYDPYGWLVWGHQTLHASLDLGGAPSWKPLPYLFTVPYSLTGRFAMWLWMVTSVTISLSGAIFAGRLAYRLTGTDGARGRWPGIAAALFAGVALLGIDQYMHDILSVQSDPMIVSLCLAAIDCHLSRRHRWAFWLLVLGSLGRPEVWPFVGLYGIWAWWQIPEMRWMVYAGLALIPILWFGVPTITNQRPFVSAQLALLSPRELHGNKFTGTINRYTTLQYLPVQLAAVAGLVLAVIRRDRVVLVLAGAVVLWLVVEIAFALHGWPAVPRYMFEAEGLTIVIGGVAVGWLLKDGVAVGSPAVSRWIGYAAVVILAAFSISPALSRLRFEHGDLIHERARTKQIGLLAGTINHLGGYKHILACGEPVTNVEYVSILAWLTRLNVGKIGHRPQYELHQKYPIVLFTQLRNGWAVTPYRTPDVLRGSCSHALFVRTPRQPNGALVRR
jgi:hypothetical protein